MLMGLNIRLHITTISRQIIDCAPKNTLFALIGVFGKKIVKFVAYNLENTKTTILYYIF